MKYWLTGLLTLLMVSSVWADNYPLVSSRSKKLDVWIDNVKDGEKSSWCAAQLTLRIVARGEKNSDALTEFMPQLGGFLQSQCAGLRLVDWQLNDTQGVKLAQGTAAESDGWQLVVTPQASAPAAVVDAQHLSPMADTTPWFPFSLLDGCQFRTYWQEAEQVNALFVSGKDGVTCDDDNWLNGQSQITCISQGVAKSQDVTFLKGFPLVGISGKADRGSLQITTVNNERMVLSDERSPQSWMILPWTTTLSGWQATGTVAVQMDRRLAGDEDALKARIDEVRKVWSPYVANGKLTILLVSELHPQLKNPAADAWRTIN